MAADPLDDYIGSVSKAFGLTVEEAWRPAVRANLEVSLRLGRLVDEFTLPDETACKTGWVSWPVDASRAIRRFCSAPPSTA